MSEQRVNVALVAPLRLAERATLETVLNLIVPPSADGRLPGAAQYDVWGHVCAAAPESTESILADLAELDGTSKGRHGQSFAALDALEARALVDELRASRPDFLGALARQTVRCYYQQDAVLEAIGSEARPPYPGGYEVHAGDLSLLDPVRKRGKIYRDV